MRNLKPRRFGTESFLTEVLSDLASTGFAVIKGYECEFDSTWARKVMNDWDNWFVAGGDDSFLYNKETQSGWFPPDKSEKVKKSDLVDLKEYFHYFPWGQCPAHLKKNTQAHFEQMRVFALRLLDDLDTEMMLSSIDNHVDYLLDLAMECDNHLLRILRYPPKPSNVENITRAAPHTDINLLTFIPSPSAKGLQVLKNDKWIDIPIDKDYMIINVGDALELATKGFLKSARHRVVFTEDDQPRMSMPFFLHAHPDAKITPDITAGEHLKQRLKELGVA